MTGEILTSRSSYFVASGGWCAPVTTFYNVPDHLAGLWPDRSPLDGLDLDRLVAPRLTTALRRWRALRRELVVRPRLAWKALRYGSGARGDDDWWSDEW